MVEIGGLCSSRQVVIEHVYAGRQHLGNIETTGQPVNGKVWKWEAGAGMPHAGPIESPQRYTASATQFYMVSDERNVERKSYRVASITAGDYNDDSRYAEWQQVNGNVTPTRPALMAYKSEMFNAYQVTLDADRASSAATNHALQLAASDLEYEGTRVKSPVLGRDLNPMGRGDGAYYANGGNAAHKASLAFRILKPRMLGINSSGFGNGMNNQCCGAGAAGGFPGDRGDLPIPPPPYRNRRYPVHHHPLETPTGPRGWDTPIIYYSPLYDSCKGKSSAVCDLWRPPAPVTGLHACCSNTCRYADALRTAYLINNLVCSAGVSKPACEAWVVHLPLTMRQAVNDAPPCWAITVGFTCSSSYGLPPIVLCWCKTASTGRMTGTAFQECLFEYLKIGPGCVGGQTPDITFDGHAPALAHSLVFCLRNVLNAHGNLDVLTKLGLEQLIECIMVEATLVWALCMLGWQDARFCIAEWAKQALECALTAPKDVGDHVWGEIQSCYQAAGIYLPPYNLLA